MEDANVYDIEFALALLHFMEPSSIVLKNNKRFKATLPSSKMRLFKLVEDKAKIEIHWALAEKGRRQLQLNSFPMIYGVGETNKLVSEFTLKFNQLNYTFDSFVEALDGAFKFYIFFKLPFSPEHRRFWALINGLFYKIDTPLLEMTSAISSCLNSFKIE